MSVKQDYVAYSQSIGQELLAVQNRVRHLIGNAHWLTDGEHKEAVLRKVLRTHLPEAVRVSKGFVCYPQQTDLSMLEDEGGTSGQLDIVITSKNKPTLLKEGELIFVTADAVEAIVEVKTQLYRGNHPDTGLETVLKKLADRTQKIRKNARREKRCLAGLFVYDSNERIDHRYLVDAIQEAVEGEPDSVINYVAIGRNMFVRYWKNGSNVHSPVAGPVWHSYQLDELAQSYFISNVVMSLSSDVPESAQRAWFSYPGGKELVRQCGVSLDGRSQF